MECITASIEDVNRLFKRATYLDLIIQHPRRVWQKEWPDAIALSPEKRKPTSSYTSTDQAGYDKRIACRFRRLRRRGPSSTLPVLGRSRKESKKTYFALTIKGPSWLWQTNSVPLSEMAPPCAQFHSFYSWVFVNRKERIPTWSCTSTNQAGCGKRTACRCRRRRRREPSSTQSPAGFSLAEMKENLRRLVHPQAKLAMTNEQRSVV